MSGEEDGADVLRRLKQAHGADPAALAELVEQAGRRYPNKRKAIRAGALLRAFRRAAMLAEALGWQGSVTLRGGRVIVDMGGTPVYGDRDERFFKGVRGASQAKRLIKTLRERGLPLDVFFDVGANVGEFALFVAGRLPRARVFAFEPAPENLAALEENLALQDPPLANFHLIREAVSDRKGEIEILVGAHELNTVMVEASLARIEARAPEVERRSIPTDTLDGYCRRLGVERVDLLKIDIEGAEPLLADSIERMAGRIGASFVEVSPFNTVEAYGRLADAFAAGGLLMMDAQLQPIDEPRAWIGQAHAKGEAPNVWFLPPGR